MDPTKKVMASAAAPTACTYGIAPRAKQEAPSMNSQAMAELRRAGSTRTSNSGAGTRCRGSIRATRFAPESFGVFRLLLVVTYSGYHAPPASSVLG